MDLEGFWISVTKKGEYMGFTFSSKLKTGICWQDVCSDFHLSARVFWDAFKVFVKAVLPNESLRVQTTWTMENIENVNFEESNHDI